MNALKGLAVLFFGLLWVAGVAVSLAVPVAVVYGVYWFVTHYKG